MYSSTAIASCVIGVACIATVARLDSVMHFIASGKIDSGCVSSVVYVTGST